MKNLIYVAIGAFLMYIVLKILSSRDVTGSSDTTAQFMALAKTPQMMNLVRTNEARELVKTPEFKQLVKTLANDQAAALSTALLNV